MFLNVSQSIAHTTKIEVKLSVIKNMHIFN